MIITLPGNKKHWPCFQEIWFLTSEVWFPGFLTYSERLYSPGAFHSLKVSIGIRWFPSFFLLQKFCNFNTFPLWMTFLPVLYFLCLYEKELQNWHLFQHSFFCCTIPSLSWCSIPPAAINFVLSNPTVSLAWSYSPTVLLIIDAFSLFQNVRQCLCVIIWFTTCGYSIH